MISHVGCSGIALFATTYEAAAVGLVNTTYLLAPVIADDVGRHDPCDNWTIVQLLFLFGASGPSVQCWPSFCYGMCQN